MSVGGSGAPRPAGPRPYGDPGNRPTLREERRLWRAGHQWVAGMDEVGRGAWAGPVSVGVAVIAPRVPASSIPTWLRDSKRLGELRREAVFEQVAAWCTDGAVGHASPIECDRWGMTAALRLAAYRALACLEISPHAIVVDGPVDLLAERPDTRPGRLSWICDETDVSVASLPDVAITRTVVPRIGADSTSAAVAAASVLAKVVRDRLMRREAEHYPAYDFDRNKGYPSPAHQVALRGYGLSAIHRRSWAYVGGLPLG